MEKRDRNIILLSSIFISSLVVANLIGSKLVLVWGIKISAGAIVIPVTFLMTDLLSELYGKKVASTVVLCGLAIQLYVLFMVWLGGILPASPDRDLTLAYKQMFELTPRMILASIVAYSCSQFIDVKIYHFLKQYTQDRHIWLRNNLSTMVSQFIDTAIFLSIFLGGILSYSELVHYFFAIYGLKLLMALCDTPFMYLGKYWLEDKHESLPTSTTTPQ